MCDTDNKSFQAVAYDSYAGCPLKLTMLCGKWWVTTPNMCLQTLDDYFKQSGFEPEELLYLCEAGGTVGALALAQMLGRALNAPESDISTVLHQRVNSLKRLGVRLNVKDEPLVVNLRVFGNRPDSQRQGKYSMWCYLDECFCEMLFDVDGFDRKEDAEEWADTYFSVLKELGMECTIINE